MHPRIQDRDTPLYFKMYNFVRKDISIPGQSGIVIAIKKILKYDSLDLSFLSHSTVELIEIRIYIDDTPFTIINLYRHSSRNTPSTFFQQFFGYISSLTNAIIMVAILTLITQNGDAPQRTS